MHPLLFMLNAAAVLVTLVFTETRSAVLLFPVICCVTIVLFFSRTPKKTVYDGGGVSGDLDGGGLYFQQAADPAL